MMSRTVRVIAAAAAVQLLLSACLTGESGDDGDDAAQPGEDADAEEPATIEFWSMPFWIGDDQKVAELVDEFNASHDVTVEFTALEWQDGREKVKQAVAAGTGPDVFLMNNGLDLDYLTAGSLAALPDLGYSQEAVDAFLPLVEVNEYEGELYGAPLYFDAVVLLYRPDVLAEYGYDAPPATWAELKEIAATITTESGGEVWGWQFKGMDDHLNAIHSTWQTFLRQAGGNYMSDDLTRSAEDGPAGETAMEYLRSFYEEEISPVGTSAVDGFVSGNVAMFNFYQTVNVADVDGEWAIAPMPEGPDNGQSMVGGHSLVANADSAELAAAGEFMRWLASPEQSLRYMDFRAIFPYDLETVPDDVRAEVDQQIETDDNWVAIFEQASRNDPAVLQQDRYANSARWSAQAANVIAGVNGQQSVPDALAAIDEEINEALDAG